jgi:molecular chaperone DnaK
MVQDAEKNASEDKRRREEIDTRNRLDSMTYEVEKNSKEWADRLSPEHKSKLEAAVERARKALRGDDIAEIRAAQEELTRVYGEAGQSLYAQQGAQAGTPEGESGSGPSGSAGAQPSGSAKPDDAVEADYEIVDEKK